MCQDGYVTIQAFSVEKGVAEKDAHMAGEAHFDIYPRTNPAPNSNTDFEESMYNKEDVSYQTVCLHEYTSEQKFL